MIFATVGTQLPFDRLLTALDDWAARNASMPVLAQTGTRAATFPSLKTFPKADQKTFSDTLNKARVVVAHAGMGTILSASEAGKRLILMPRRAEFGEHRNDHQLATAEEMSVLSNVTVVHDAQALWDSLDAVLAEDTDLTPAPNISAVAQPRLIRTIQDFIWTPSSQPAVWGMESQGIRP
jgi:UDP-N-acetylglucosamine transferase subunit ALG13